MIKTALYVRVSHDEQATNGDSLRAQTDILKDYAKQNKLYISKIYTDDGYTAKTLKRPALQELLEDIKRGEINLILFTKIDRWSRGVRNYYKIQDILDEHKVHWKTVLEDYDTTTTVGQLQINIMLTIAENEANMTSDRIKTVFKSKLAQGEVISGSLAIRGYDIVNKKLVINKEESLIVQDLFDAYEKLMNMTRLVIYAKDRYPTYTRNVLSKMLRNKLYIGIYESEYGTFENYCDPIISKEQFETVQRILAQNSKYHEKNNEYIFNGLLRCGICGKKLTANTAVQTSGRYEKKPRINKTHRCPNHWRNRRCDNNYVVTELTIEKYLLSNFIEQYKEYQLDFEVKEKEYKSTACIDIAKIKKKLDKLYDLYDEELISKEKYKSEYQRLNELLEECEKNNKPPRKPLELTTDFTDKDAISLYHDLSLHEKKSLWMKFINEIKIQRGKFEIDFL